MTILQIAIVNLLVLTVIIPLAILIPQRARIDKPVLIYSDEDFLKYDFVGEGTEANPFLIENLTIDRDFYGNSDSDLVGIFVENTTKHFIIQNCVIKNYDFGIGVGNLANNTAIVRNNHVEAADKIGIICVTNGMKVENNEINDGNGYAIYIVGYSGSLIRNNTIYNNYSGIVILSSEYNVITQNNCRNNTYPGIACFDSDYTEIEDNIITMNQGNNDSSGFFLVLSDFLTIRNNTITENGYHGIIASSLQFSVFEFNNISFNRLPDIPHYGDGIFMENSKNNTIRSNFFRENGAYGVNLLESHNNSIHHNAFILNDQNIQNQAFEENCTNNLWHESATLEGNHWQGWNASLVYEIGGGISLDLYPLEENPLTLFLSELWLKKTKIYT
ncbi:MAG: right-handed parallel beta-helix repeat-containing protein [Candidatus Heimdallarchaeaceae archaeon]